MTQRNGEGASVVSLNEYRGGVQHPALSLVEAYWEGLRAGRLVPRRAEVDPRGIDQALDHAFILERIAPGMARFRLAGMHLNDLMGMEVRGMPLTSFFVPGSRPLIGETLEHVFEEPATARLSLRGESGLGRPALEADLLLLPLKSDLGDISRVLGCLVARGDIGRTPRRFVVTDTRRTGLLDATLAAPGEPPAATPVPREPLATGPVEPEPTGLDEAPAPFSHDDRRTPGERPYLRLVRSDEE